MAATAFFAYLLLAGGPPVVLWCTFIANKSFLVLLALASAFYWLLTLLVVSLLFRAFVPLPEHAAIYGLTLGVAVVLQEASRYGLFRMHRIIVQQLGVASRHLDLPKPTLDDRRLMALTHGMGHAIAQTTFLYFSWISLAAGPGTLYNAACPKMSYFLTAGLLTLAFFFLHTFSMVAAFHGYEREQLGLVGGVAALHLLAAETTTLNMLHGWCVPATSVALCWGGIATVVAAFLCFKFPQEDEAMRHLASSTERSAEAL